MNSLLKILPACIILSSCAVCKHEPKIEYRDSIRIEYRDRIVHDTATFEIPVIIEKNVTRDTSSHLENPYAKSDAVVSGGLLWHSLESIPQTIKAPVKIEVHDTTYIEKSSVKTEEEVPVEKPLTWWQTLKIGAFWWLLAALLLTNIKPIIKLIKKLAL